MINIEELITESIKNSSFFENKYNNLNLKKIKSLNQIPTTSKTDLLKIANGSNIENDSLKNQSQGVFVRVTSGTTSKMSCFYRTQEEIYESIERFKIAAQEFKSNKKDKVMIISNPTLSYIFVEQFMKAGFFVTLGFPEQLETTAEMIIQMKCNVIRATPPIALRLAKILNRRNYNDIDKLLLASSTLSSVGRERLKELFPKSTIIMQYGMAETAISLYQTKEEFGTQRYRTFNRDFIYEFLDLEKDENVNIGEIGELTITKINTINPLVRYRTGDIFKIIKQFEDGTYLIEMFGRKGDQIKVNGIVIFKEKIDEAILEFKDIFDGEYQIQFDEINNENEILSQLTLILKGNNPGENIIKNLIENFSNKFQVSESFTWKEGESLGLFAPIKIKFVEKFDGHKTPNIIDNRLQNG